MDIDTAREMLAAASQGRWAILSSQNGGVFSLYTGLAGDDFIATFDAQYRDGFAGPKNKANAQLAASVPATLAALILAVEALENALAEIHYHHGCDPDCEEKRHKALAAWRAL